MKAGEKPFANPRNAAAGSIRIQKNRDIEDRRLSFMAYAIVLSEDTGASGEFQLRPSFQVSTVLWFCWV